MSRVRARAGLVAVVAVTGLLVAACSSDASSPAVDAASSAPAASSSALGGQPGLPMSPLPPGDPSGSLEVDPADQQLADYVQKVSQAVLSGAAQQVFGPDKPPQPETAEQDLVTLFADVPAWTNAIAAAAGQFADASMPLSFEGSATPVPVDPSNGVEVSASREGRTCTVVISVVTKPRVAVDLRPVCGPAS